MEQAGSVHAGMEGPNSAWFRVETGSMKATTTLVKVPIEQTVCRPAVFNRLPGREGLCDPIRQHSFFLPAMLKRAASPRAGRLRA